MAVKPTRLSILPEEWLLPFLASWRTFERCLNPAFFFAMACTSCNTVGSPTIDFVRSKKAGKTVIGLQCECGNTLKFEVPLSTEDEQFPARLKKAGKSVLEPDGALASEPDTALITLITKLVLK